MSVYDSMSAKELLREYTDEVVKALVTHEPFTESYMDALESALRKAIIREASMGVVKLAHNGVASDYDIIPKETP